MNVGDARRYGEALLYLGQEDIGAASAVVTRPDSSLYSRTQMAILAWGNMLQDDTDVARFIAALGRGRGVAETLYLGEWYLANWNYARARTILEGLVRVAPDTARAQRRLAQALDEGFQDPEGAIPHWREAIRLEPMTMAADYYYLGHDLFLLGRPGEAIPVLEQARRLDPNDDRILLDLAQSQLGILPPDDLLAIVQEAVHLNSMNGYAYSLMSSIYLFQKRDQAQAERAAENALALQPNDTWALWLMAQIRLMQNRPEEALSYSEQGLEVDPQHSALWESVGDALLQMGQVNAACQAYRRITPIESDVEAAARLSEKLAASCASP
jgi:tetratricopeptide (TPR) repeat protein